MGKGGGSSEVSPCLNIMQMTTILTNIYLFIRVNKRKKHMDD